MQIKPFAFILILSLAGCVSLLSQKTDEEAWNDYLKEIRSTEQQEARTPASNDDKQVQPSVKILREILKDLPFRNYLISCDSMECYQSNLIFAYDEVFRRVKNQEISLNPEQYKTEQKKFIEQYGYFKMMKMVESFHHILFSGVELRAASRAAELAHVCKSSIGSDEQVQISEFSPYSGGLTYMPRTFYVCLNTHWNRELEQLLKETCERLGIVIKTEQARSWILKKQIFPIFQKTLEANFVKRNEEEKEMWLKEWKQLQAKMEWDQPVEQRISKWAPELRKKYHFLNIEALLTEAKPSKN
jgi:hypothetical protein